jgi:hypothetical protein
VNIRYNPGIIVKDVDLAELIYCCPNELLENLKSEMSPTKGISSEPLAVISPATVSALSAVISLTTTFAPPCAIATENLVAGVEVKSAKT